jgi:hypothetical protein
MSEQQTRPPPEHPFGQDDERPDLGLLILVVRRLLNDLLTDEEVDRLRVEAVLHAVERFEEMSNDR